jgi:Tol biopolymer transport system component
MAKSNHFGVLAAAAGALVAVVLLVLLLVVVDAQPAGAAFGGNNGAIAYAGLDGPGPAGDFEIYSIPATRIWPPSQLISNNTYDTQPCYSPDGKQIVYAGEEDPGGDLEIWTVPSTGGTVPVRRTTNDTDDTQPCYTPDGKRIVYSGEEAPGGDFEIYTQSLSPGARRFQVTDNNTDDRDPSYGTRRINGELYIAYSGEEAPGGDFEIFMIPEGGGTPRRVTDNTTPDVDPDWQPINNTRIAYAGKVPTDPGGDFEIYTVQRPLVSGTRVNTPVQRTSNGTDDISPAWAPDSQMIAFTSEDPQHPDLDIFTMSFMGGPGLGGTLRRVTNNAYNDGWPSWQPIP